MSAYLFPVRQLLFHHVPVSVSAGNGAGKFPLSPFSHSSYKKEMRDQDLFTLGIMKPQEIFFYRIRRLSVLL